MGLTVSIKGYKDAYDCGYITFMRFRVELAKAFDPVFGGLYEKWCMDGLTQDECDTANRIMEGHDALDLFLTHSDCDGKFTPKECRAIYDEIKDMHMDMLGHNYGDVNTHYNMLEKWKDMFLFCARNRVNMFFE